MTPTESYFRGRYAERLATLRTDVRIVVQSCKSNEEVQTRVGALLKKFADDTLMHLTFFQESMVESDAAYLKYLERDWVLKYITRQVEYDLTTN